MAACQFKLGPQTLAFTRFDLLPSLAQTARYLPGNQGPPPPLACRRRISFLSPLLRSVSVVSPSWHVFTLSLTKFGCSLHGTYIPPLPPSTRSSFYLEPSSSSQSPPPLLSMSDLDHPLQELNCRKRKADSDDDTQHPISNPNQSTTDPILVDRPASPLRPPHAPRQPPTSPWLSTDTARAVWPSEHSPTDPPPVSPLNSDPVHARFHKRPRIDTSPHPRGPDRLPPSRASLSPHTPTRRSRRRHDHRELPSPSPSSPQSPPLRIDQHLPSAHTLHPALQPPFPHVDLTSPHIPSLHPLINRQTLKELDLSAILRNPQLRTSPLSHIYYRLPHSFQTGHDLLFDAGLQFRPTSGRKKRELSDKYWRAVAQELENACTCISFDMQWRPSDCVCVCRRVPLPPQNPVLTYSTSRRVLTLRMPSRIRLLLTEFLEVLLLVIQPLTSISDTYANPSTFQAQIERHAAQAAHLRSVFDPDLIHQELQHNLFDPSGLFIVIGETLKSHCAPMRDRAVDAMVEVARACAPGGGGSKADAVKAVRMCLDILELMKLVRPLTGSSFFMLTYKLGHCQPSITNPAPFSH